PKQGIRRPARAGAPVPQGRQGRGHRRHRPQGQVGLRRLHGRRLGRSNRQVVAIGEHLAERLKQAGHGYTPVEGKQVGDWVLVDAGDVVVHVFRPEPRAFYALEKMWALETEVAAKPRPVKPRSAEPKTAKPRRKKP